MARKSSQDRRIMLSAYKREATYGAGVTMNSTNACEMFGYTGAPPAFPDEVEHDGDSITGTLVPTQQEILTKKVEISYTEPRAHPNAIAALAALAFGSPTSTQDGGFAAYRHRFILPTAGAAAQTGQAESLDGDQRAYRGVGAKSFQLSGEAGKYLELTGSLIGSGYRATSATAFAAKVSEPWMKTSDMRVWLESGANRSIGGPTQAAEDISSATPDDLKARVTKFAFGVEDCIMPEYGFGGAGLVQGIYYHPQPKVSLGFSLAYDTVADLDYYLNQDALALEFDLQHGTLIDAGGAFYYGLSLIVPHAQLKSVGRSGAVGEFQNLDFDVTVLDDGTNEPFYLDVYTAKAAYLAA